MHANQTQQRTQEDKGAGYPIEAIIAVSVIALGVIALILKSLGVF
jgi:hypothetical protein